MKKKNIFNWFRRKKQPTKQKQESKKEYVKEPIKDVEDKKEEELIIPRTYIVPPLHQEEQKNDDEIKITDDEIKVIKAKKKNNIDNELTYIEDNNNSYNNDYDYNFDNDNSKQKDDNDIKQTLYNHYPSITNINDYNVVLEQTEPSTIKAIAIDEIEWMLKKDHYKLSKIKYELDTIETKEKEELTIQEAEDLIHELTNLIRRFEKLKKQFYENDYDNITLSDINNNYLRTLIFEYKEAIKNNDLDKLPLLQIKEIEEYIEIIETIASIESRTEELNEKLENRKEIEEKEIQEKLDNTTRKTKQVEKINKYIERFSKEQEQLIKDIKTKVNSSEKTTKTVEYKTDIAINYSKILTGTLFMASTSIIPPTKIGNLLKISLLATTVVGLSRAVRVYTKEKKTTTTTTFIDYEKDIKSNLKNVDDMSSTIDKTITDVKKLKKNFTKEFRKYRKEIPEYYDILSKLTSLEKELILKQQIANDFDKDLNQELEKNNTKVKRLNEEYCN